MSGKWEAGHTAEARARADTTSARTGSNGHSTVVGVGNGTLSCDSSDNSRHGCTSNGSNSCASSGRRGSSSGRKGDGRNSSSAANNVSNCAGAVLGNSHLLEVGLGLLGSWIDGESHALTAVVTLLAVKP